MDQGPGTRQHGLMVHGPWTMDHGPWNMEHGPWTMDHGPWLRRCTGSQQESTGNKRVHQISSSLGTICTDTRDPSRRHEHCREPTPVRDVSCCQRAPVGQVIELTEMEHTLVPMLAHCVALLSKLTNQLHGKWEQLPCLRCLGFELWSCLA